ncbi:hypothetical protein FJZ33_08240 [Candidatus Poribacteria bacterium]|nr:hypothetical protein [Candidatus Poribacteria bacterium]
MDTKQTGDEALYGIKLQVDIYANTVAEILRDAGIQVIQSPSCFKIIHTSFHGSLKELIKKLPELSNYPIKKYR